MMLWKVDDQGSYDQVFIREMQPRNGSGICWAVCWVLSPAMAFTEPTDADRTEMLEIAQGIVDRHNAVQDAEERFAVACKRCKRNESYKTALSMIAQLLCYRVPSMIAQAALDGADFTDEETAINVAEGKWRKP